MEKFPDSHSTNITHCTMAATDLKKRKRGDERPAKRKVKIRKQAHYSSSSSPEPDNAFNPVDLADSDSDSGPDSAPKRDDDNIAPPQAQTQLKKKITRTPAKPAPAETASQSASDSDSDNSSLSSNPSQPNSNRADKSAPSKRNDPTAFASSISAILNSKLTTSKRADPVLARSATAADANASLANAKLEAQARQKIRQDKKAALEKGRVKDVLLGTDDPAVTAHRPKPAATDEKGTGNNNVVVNDEHDNDENDEDRQEKAKEMQESEKRLRKTAQRGVVKLFNAVRQAQVRAEEAAKEAAAKGVVGRAQREEKIGEMSRKGFLEMVAAGGTSAQREGAKKLESARIEET